MASSSHPSRGSRGKAVAIARGVDPSGWINDDETQVRLMDGRVKIVVPPKYLNLSLFEIEGVFYNNLKIVNDDIQSRVKGVNIYIDNNVWLQVVGLKAEVLVSRILIIQGVDISGERKCSCNWTNVINRNIIASLRLESIDDKLLNLKHEKKSIKERIECISPELKKLNEAVNKSNAEIRKLERRINEITDRIYRDFSKSVGVANICEYEENRLKAAQNTAEERLKLSSQLSKSKYQLEYEQNRDMSSRILELEASLSALEKDLKRVQDREAAAKVAAEKSTEEVNQLKEEIKEWKSKSEEYEKEIQEWKKKASAATTNISKLNRLIHSKVRCTIILSVPYLVDQNQNVQLVLSHQYPWDLI
ncbi:structural maintenance of chromosomes protein 1-like [Vigna radiata var. radiata]|uniref:Structural maintenance of chromosomes protein 1-like n=1 Tax=Vigna radiata var. radiata TaxID=3916 RepID=A0A3Q0FA76_VIGRR|nr:structural maintenance of chromosomes protein 1-like [Vigna radiata var. radiata]